MKPFLFENDGADSVNAPGGDRVRDAHDSPLFSVVKHVELYGNRLDGQQFSAMCLVDDVHEIRDFCSERMHGPTVGAWI